MTENTELQKAIEEGRLSFTKGELGKSICEFSEAIRLDPAPGILGQRLQESWEKVTDRD
jgi:hypothetical protein